MHFGDNVDLIGLLDLFPRHLVTYNPIMKSITRHHGWSQIGRKDLTHSPNGGKTFLSARKIAEWSAAS